MPGPRLGRGCAAVFIGQCINDHIGEFRLNGFGYSVDKADQGSCMAAFLFVHLGALGAFAVAIAVILGYGKYLLVRVLPDGAPEVFRHNRQHLRIGQAKLRRVGPP